MGPEATSQAGPTLETVLPKWRDAWEESRRKSERGDDHESERLAESLTSCLRSLVWAAGRLGVAQAILLEMVGSRAEDRIYRPLRLEAVMALAAGKPSPSITTALEAVAQGDDPELRALVASVAGREGGRSRSIWFRSSCWIGPPFRGLCRTRRSRRTTWRAPRQAWSTSKELFFPTWLSGLRVEALAAVLKDRKLSAPTRLGAVEALGESGPGGCRGPAQPWAWRPTMMKTWRKAAWARTPARRNGLDRKPRHPTRYSRMSDETPQGEAALFSPTPGAGRA